MGGMKCRKALLCFLVTLTSLSVLPSAPSKADEGDNKDIDLVILVDESTSLSPGDVEQEQLAVRNIIALPQLLDQRIRVSVLPFSSGPNSPRLVTGCEFTELNPEGQDYLLEYCPDQIRRERRDDGPDAAGNTDFAKAIDVAIQKLREVGSDSRRKAILLLTDGRYDPDGNQSVATEEDSALNAALDRARVGEVSIWPLGFGDTYSIDFEGLRRYASNGYQGQGKCPKPEAALSAPEQLAAQIYGIISAVACIDVQPPRPTPSTFDLHPLVDQISAVVLGSNDEPTMKDSSGNVVCAGQWENRSGVYSCQLSIDGSRPGEWMVIGSADSQIVWVASGEVVVSLEACDSRPTLEMKRRDNNPINWSDDYSWPTVEVFEFTESREPTRRSYEVELSKESHLLELDRDAQSVVAELVPMSDEKLKGISLVDRAECEISSSAVVTTTSSPEDTVPLETSNTGDKGENNESEVEPTDFPWFWIALLVFTLTLAGFGFRRILNARKFPRGSELKQRMPSGKWILLDIRLEGLRRAGVKLGSPGQAAREISVADLDVDVILTYHGKELRVSTPKESGDEKGAEDRIEALNYPFQVQEFEFRVDVPEEEPEEDF
jgi:hypothetical protein